MKRIWYCGCPFICNYTLTKLERSEEHKAEFDDPENSAGSFRISVEIHSEPVFDSEFLGSDTPLPKELPKLPGYADGKLGPVDVGCYVYEDNGSFILQENSDVAFEFQFEPVRRVVPPPEGSDLSACIEYGIVGYKFVIAHLPKEKVLVLEPGKCTYREIWEPLMNCYCTKLWDANGFATQHVFAIHELVLGGFKPVGCSTSDEMLNFKVLAEVLEHSAVES